MIITIANTKGGVGKSTLALNIAVERARQGREVLVIDADRQATIQTAIAARASGEISPALACVKLETADLLLSQLRIQRSKYDDVVIDAGGRDSEALRAALTVADVALTPFAPRTFEVWALDDIAAIIRAVDPYRAAPLRALAVLNLADPKGADNLAAAEYVPPPFELLSVQVVRRKSIADAAGAGRAVAEAARRDPKAAAEIAALVSQVFSM